MAQSLSIRPHWLYLLVRWGMPLQVMVIGAALLMAGAQEAYRAERSPSWPAVPGTIRLSDIQHTPLSKGSKYHANVVYEYRVDGRYHQGRVIGFPEFRAAGSADLDLQQAQAILRRYPPGKQVTVYCRPGHPDDCVLEPGVRDGSWFLARTGLAVFAVGSLLLALLPWLLQQTTRSSRRT